MVFKHIKQITDMAAWSVLAVSAAILIYARLALVHNFKVEFCGYTAGWHNFFAAMLMVILASIAVIIRHKPRKYMYFIIGLAVGYYLTYESIFYVTGSSLWLMGDTK